MRVFLGVKPVFGAVFAQCWLCQMTWLCQQQSPMRNLWEFIRQVRPCSSLNSIRLLAVFRTHLGFDIRCTSSSTGKRLWFILNTAWGRAAMNHQPLYFSVQSLKAPPDTFSNASYLLSLPDLVLTRSPSFQHNRSENDETEYDYRISTSSLYLGP